MFDSYRVALSFLLLITAIAARSEQSAYDLAVAGCNVQCTENAVVAVANAPKLSNTQRTFTGSGTGLDGTAAVSTTGAPPAQACDTSILQLVASNPAIAATAQNNPDIQAKIQAAQQCAQNGGRASTGAQAAFQDVGSCVQACMVKFRADNGLPSEADASKSEGNGKDFATVLQLVGGQGQNGDQSQGGAGDPSSFYQNLPGPAQ